VARCRSIPRSSSMRDPLSGSEFSDSDRWRVFPTVTMLLDRAHALVDAENTTNGRFERHLECAVAGRVSDQSHTLPRTSMLVSLPSAPDRAVSSATLTYPWTQSTRSAVG